MFFCLYFAKPYIFQYGVDLKWAKTNKFGQAQHLPQALLIAMIDLLCRFSSTTIMG